MEKKRPIGLIVAVVVGVALGLLGLLGGCTSIASLMTQDSLVEMQAQLGRGDPALAAQAEVTRRMIEVQAGFRVWMFLGEGANFLVSALLLVGAGLLAALKRSGGRLLIVVAAVAILVDGYRTALGVYVSWRSTSVMAEAFAAHAPAGGAAVAGFTQGATTVGLIIAVLWFAAKLVAYAAQIWAARDAEAKGLLG